MDWALAACFVALTGSFIVSYARARAEGLGIPGSSGGLMGRPERLVIVGRRALPGRRGRRAAGADGASSPASA